MIANMQWRQQTLTNKQR
jgi:hypothetical protein